VRRARRFWWLGLALALAGCVETATPMLVPVPRAAPEPSRFGEIKTFSRSFPNPPARANADMVRDFLDLHFRLESGHELRMFTRFEAPLTLRVTGQPVPTLDHDLDRLLGRLRRDAGISIKRVSDLDAVITVEVVPSREIRKILPSAACFVLPNVSSLAEYAADRRAARVDWTRLTARETAALVVPSDISPQELRDCLHEELAQSLGPVNDLYRLPDSIFNDDNVHTVLTGFDMLMLRAAYAPELRSGMTRDQVAAVLPKVLARLNPAGEGRASNPLPPTPRNWAREIEAALGPDRNLDSRLSAATSARRIALRQGWRDQRLAFSNYTLGLMVQGYDATEAQSYFAAALQALEGVPDAEIYRTVISAQVAAYALATGRPERTIAITERYLPIARRYENALIMATLMMMQAEALTLSGRDAEARAVRLDSYGWARYGLGSDQAISARLDDIAALAGYGSLQIAARLPDGATGRIE